MNLTLSKRGDYVVRSAICLACAYGSDTPKKRRQVSAEMGVPRTFVSQILGDLVRAGLAVSSFGKAGGYRLARPPAEVSLLEVVEAGEGPLAPGTCALGDGPCRLEAVCPVHESLGAASSALREELAATSLADVAGRFRPIEAGTEAVTADARRRAALTVPVADSVQVELAAPAVAARLRASGSWLASHVEAASADGEATRVRVGPGGPAWLGKTVAVHLGEPEGTDEALVIPLTWKATGPAGLFPRLEAELRLSALDPERAELTLSGRYRPPLGRAGQALDEALLTHVAGATVRSFLRRVAQTLEEGPAVRHPTSRAGPASGRRPPEDLCEDLIEFVGRPGAPEGAEQRRGRDSHAHEQVVGDSGEGGHNQHAEKDAERLDHGFVVKQVVLRWNAETTVRRPQILRMRTAIPLSAPVVSRWWHTWPLIGF